MIQSYLSKRLYLKQKRITSGEMKKQFGSTLAGVRNPLRFGRGECEQRRKAIKADISIKNKAWQMEMAEQKAKILSCK